MNSLSKDLDAFYTMFIQQFASVEREMSHVPNDLITNPQLDEILSQVSREPFLVNLLPHMVKFVETKSLAILQEP